MKHLTISLLLMVFLLHTAVYAQLKIKKNTRGLLVPEIDSLERFMELNKIDYALITYSTSNWIGSDYIFNAIIKKNKRYYLTRLANLNYYRKDPKLKMNQKKLTVPEAEEYLAKIAPAEVFKFSEMDYRGLPTNCIVIHGADSLTFGGVSDDSKLHIFEYSKHSKRNRGFYAPQAYLKNCYPLNPEYGILKGFVNTYDTLTDLVEESFTADPIPPIQERVRITK